MRLLRIEKIAVFAPIPSASDRMAIAVTTGVAFRARKASLRSCMHLPVVPAGSSREGSTAIIVNWLGIGNRGFRRVSDVVQCQGGMLEGVYSVLPTPFQTNGDLDEPSLRRVVDLFIAAGVNGVTALGVTGEVARVEEAERA